MHRTILQSLIVVGIAFAAASCSPNFHAKTCAVDDDCGGGLVCGDATGAPVCVTAAAAPVHIGMSAPITGPSQDLGIEMRKGVMLAINEQNAAGGVHGRPIVLDFRDDQYDPTAAEEAARDLLGVTTLASAARCPTTTEAITAGSTPVANGGLLRGPNAALGLLGNVGTPTMVRTAPIAVETGSLFFGAFTGASKVLRDGMAGPCAKYIFNVRASYAQEARATLEYFLKLNVPDASHLISFDQNDSFGDAGYSGLTAAWQAIKGSQAQITRFRYTRDDETSVPAQVTLATAYLRQLLNDGAPLHTVGIMMTDTYGPATTFIKGIRDWQYANDQEQSNDHKATRLQVFFSNVSFVGPNSLAGRLHDAGSVMTPTGPQPYSNGVLVSNVVPNYGGDSAAIRAYKKALGNAQLDPSFTSLEGYLAARVFVSGLAAHQGPFTPEALISTFEQLPPLNLGLGATARFTPDDHNYSKAVFGTSLTADGGFSDLYFWSDGSSIQLFE